MYLNGHMIELIHKSPDIDTSLPLEPIKRRVVHAQYFRDVPHNPIRGSSHIAMILLHQAFRPGAHPRSRHPGRRPSSLGISHPRSQLPPSRLTLRLRTTLARDRLLPQNLTRSHESTPQKSAHNPHAPRGPQTHSPPCQAPRPRTDSACTLVMRSRFSRSARLAESCASWAWRCDCVWSACAIWGSGGGRLRVDEV
jgi:hypothetical protein